MSVASPPGRAGVPSEQRRPVAARPDRRVVRWLVGITLVAAVVRFSTLSVQSFWLDEAATVELMRRGFFDMLGHLDTSESCPPLYYVLAWLWSQVLGTGEAGLRSLSAVFGTALVPVAFLAVRRASDRAGLWAAGIAAASPLTFYYAQEARVYGLLILLSGIAFVLFQRLCDRPSRRLFALWSLVSALALCTHYFAAFPLVGEVLWLWRAYGARRLAPWLALPVVTGLALAPLADAQRKDHPTDWIEGKSLISRAAQAPKQFLVGIDSPLELVAAGLCGVLVVGAIALLVTRGTRREQRIALQGLVVLLVALGIPLVLSVSGAIDVFNGRNVVAAWIPSMAVVAVGLGLERAPRAGALLGAGLCLVMGLTVVGVLTQPKYQRDDFRGVADGLGPARTQRLVVLPISDSLPLSLKAPGLRLLHGGAREAVAEIDVANFGERASGGPPAAPLLPDRAPAGFSLAGVVREDNYAVARYVADRPVVVDARAAGRLLPVLTDVALQVPAR